MSTPWDEISAKLSDVERDIIRAVEEAFEEGRQHLTVLALQTPAPDAPKDETEAS